jgi:hypothetical protein
VNSVFLTHCSSGGGSVNDSRGILLLLLLQELMPIYIHENRRVCFVLILLKYATS